jgi:Flp pilus assembly protein TadG
MAESVKSHRRGVSIVELAIVTPLLLLLIFGVIEYAWLFLKASGISNAAREGARYAATAGVTDLGQLTAWNSPLMRALDNADIPLESATVTCATVTPGTGQPVTVRVTVPYEAVRLIGLLPGPANLHATVTMLKEGV